jgi:hypothetical protein
MSSPPISSSRCVSSLCLWWRIDSHSWPKVCALRGFTCQVMQDIFKVCYAFGNVSNPCHLHQSIVHATQRDQIKFCALLWFLYFCFGCCVQYYHTLRTGIVFFLVFWFPSRFLGLLNNLKFLLISLECIPCCFLIYDAHWFTFDHIVSSSCP